MWSIILISLLGIGATAALAVEIFDDDDDRPAPETPGEVDPETGGPGPLPETPEDRLAGTAGADAITGTAASEPINAGLGDDIVRAGDGNDTVDAGAGDDRVFGESGDDLIAGNAGNDFLRGGADDDLLLDSDGADTLRGDTGDDLLISTGITDQAALLAAISALPDDTDADSGIDVTDLAGLDLTQDDDTEGDVVDGGAGDDATFFGQGDTVTGGTGSDVFFGGETLTAGDPAVITDFEVNEETLVLTTNGGDMPTLDVTNDNGDAVLSLDGQIAVILAGVGAEFTLADVELVDLTA